MTFELEQVTVLELDIDKCRLNYAAGACTAGTDVHTGTSQAGATANTIKLAAAASATDDLYNGDAITLADGRRAIVTDYDGTTKVATVDRDWPINLLTESERFGETDWTTLGNGVTVSSNAVLAPNGALAADKIVESSANEEHYIQQNFTPGIGITYLLSVDVKTAGESRVLYLRFLGGNTAFAIVDPSDGSIRTTGGAELDSASVEESEDGYYRVTVTMTAASTSATGARIHMREDTGGSGSSPYLGDGTSGFYVWGAQLRRSTNPAGYTRTTTARADLPDSVAYRIVEAGGECYNTFSTCQDKPNYDKARKRWSFCTAGAEPPADEQIRPYISGIGFAPTQIDIEKGLAPRGMVTVDLTDEPDSDRESDPYHATRTATAQGTFWTRLLARNPNYAGRFVRIRRAYLTGAWDWSQFVDELYIAENIKGPDGDGRVQLTAKDPVKLADRIKVPAATDGALASAITAGSTTLPMGTGDGADYPSSGWVRIGDEVIKYTTNSSDTLGGLTRGEFGTTAAAADEGDGVQLCQVWESANVSTVLQELANAGGIDNEYLDLTGWSTEDSTWLGAAFAITACITEPTDVSKLLAEVVLQSGGYMWWSPSEQKLKFEILAPLSPGETATVLTDDANMIEGTVKVQNLDGLRITRAALFYDLRSAVADRKETNSYLRGRIYADLDAEGANEFNARRDRVDYSRLWTSANDAAVNAVVSRAVGYYRAAPKQIECKVDAKDANITEGDLIDLEISQITDVTGAPETTRCIVLKRKDEAGKVALTLRTTTFGQRYAYIAPAGAGDYPIDEEYCHIAPAGGGEFSDGTGPYLII